MVSESNVQYNLNETEVLDSSLFLMQSMLYRSLLKLFAVESSLHSICFPPWSLVYPVRL